MVSGRDREYVIMLVDTIVEANSITQFYRSKITPTFKIEGYALGNSLHGLHHRGIRPTLILDFMTDRGSEHFDRWFEACVKNLMSHGKYTACYR